MKDKTSLRGYSHPYYANMGNYYLNSALSEFGSWANFVEDCGDLDMDYNLLVRFDWKLPEEEGDTPERLELAFLQQRKGRYWPVVITLTDDPEGLEQQIRYWLQIRWNHMKRLWEPFGESET